MERQMMRAEIPPYNPPTAGDYAQHILGRIIDQQPGNREKFNKFQKRAGKRNAHPDK